jgi:hypothetical protein
LKGFVRVLSAAVIISCVVLCGCEMSLSAKFAPLRPLPPGPVTKQASDIVVMSDLPTSGDQYIELGYITVDESRVSPIMTEFTTNEDVINMVRAKAAEVGADAVVKFSMTGEHPVRKAEGTAIKYEKRGG